MHDTFWHVHHTDTHNSFMFVHLAVCDGQQCRKQETFQRRKLHGNKVISIAQHFRRLKAMHSDRALKKVGLIRSSSRVPHLTQVIKLMI